MTTLGLMELVRVGGQGLRPAGGLAVLCRAERERLGRLAGSGRCIGVAPWSADAQRLTEPTVVDLRAGTGGQVGPQGRLTPVAPVECAEKRCPYCRETKGRAEFSLSWSTRDGLTGECRACMSARIRRFREARGR